MYNHIDHILVDKMWHSSIIDASSFREIDYDTDQYLVVEDVREKLSVSK
jgi:hypothetical protein